jgi:hypothetical protein
MINAITNWYRGLPEKKKYIEVLTAFLTVPVLLTVIVNNINAFRSKQETSEQKNEAVTPTTENGRVTVIPIEIYRDVPTATGFSEPPATIESPSTPQGSCKPEVGSFDIVSPIEGQVVSTNPVTVTVRYEKEGYCAVLWSYRINGGMWSDYDDKSIALYHLDSGPKVLEVKAKSIVSSEEKLVERSFIYESSNGISISPSPTQEATESAMRRWTE